ncbi:helix-turn-helix domain-containing protein [Paenibacillus sp. IB182496]|uniref:Helix-turn-helix domain-containing protein n=1 Tax=Paenibacillus sabuli TaxID=2772509 RepID=A0A927GUM3_9BACL|nr:AraC family transcriptional regulator [Paenibacillus sabuli]MBD2848506.1 helix-turn-helix domain-containing protein [Paenibacillus sabuli]
MAKSWFYKLLFSYLPIFFAVISFLIAIFFFSMGEVTRKAAETVNRGTSEHILEVVDNSLRAVEHMMIKELGATNGIQQFFNATLEDDPIRRMVNPSKLLSEMKNQFPLVDSIYLVNWEDEVVLTDTAALTMERFEDRAFVEEYLRSRKGASWTGKRPYREFPNQYDTDVLSLVKPYPVPAGDYGVMVVNVSARAITNLVKDLSDTGFITAVLMDGEGELLYASDAELPALQGAATEVGSSYSGWRIRSQLQGGAFYLFASRFNLILLLSGGVAVVAAAWFITYISRRHYRPIQSLTARLGGYARLKTEQLLRTGGRDEFAFIESALDKMIAQSDELMTEQEQHMQVRRRHWIKETLEGDYDTVVRDWDAISARFGWQSGLVRASAMTIEIDGYLAFCEKYSRRDQSLLKFLIGNVVGELAGERGLAVYGEWLEADKWCAVVRLQEEEQSGEAVALYARQLIQWVADNLDFEITIGLGDTVRGVEQISSSYEQSLQALSYKMALGSGRVIGSRDLPEAGGGALPQPAADLRGLVQAFKLGDGAWERQYDRFAEALRARVAPKEELLYQVNYVVYQLAKEMAELSRDYQQAWEAESSRIAALMRAHDTLEGLTDALREALRDVQARMGELREDRTYSATMLEVRRYIAAHSGRPDLSLTHLSEAFELSPKYVSQLFKEEFGEKFVDYLASVRTERAKRLLADTADSIQDVGLQVGYTHSFSFIRAFKKQTGMTPGEYRKYAETE